MMNFQTPQLANWSEYQDRAPATAIYPKDQELVYLTLGLSSEVAEVITEAMTPEELAGELGDVFWYAAMLGNHLNVRIAWLDRSRFAEPTADELMAKLLASAGLIASYVKKALRDDEGQVTESRRTRLIWELGMLVSAAESICWDAGVPVAKVLNDNLAKLARRSDQGVLGGDGSSR